MRKTKLQFRIIALVLTITVLLFAVVPAAAEGKPVNVYFVGSETSRVHQALTLTEQIAFVTDTGQADVFVVNGKTSDPQAIADAVKAGAGLVLFLAPDNTSEEVSILLGSQVTLVENLEPLSLTKPKNLTDVTATSIVWNSAPQVRNRMTITGADLEPIVIGFEDQSLVLGSVKLGAGQVFVYTAYLHDASNQQFQDWAYFNYLIYHLTERAAGETSQTFGDYPASPVPHTRDRNKIFSLLAVMVTSSATIFFFVRRYSRAHPEALERLVIHAKEFNTRQAKTDWEELGFHRPLSGFLLAFVSQLVLMIPLITYQAIILPVYVLPSAQALGIWGRVTQIFTVLWVLFDVGTSTAFVKFFSQYRVHEPQKAIKYVQFYVWWQALTGAFQVAWITAVASGVLPQSSMALYAWVVILHAVIQIPGFLSVFRNVLSAWQRFDYAQTLDIAVTMFFPMFTQSIIVVLMVIWGRNHPTFGAASGGLLGLPMAAYLNELLAFLLGLRLYKRLGYNSRVLFMAHFDRETIRTALGFGVYEMLGSLAYGAGQAAEIIVTTIYLVNYNEIWGNWQLALSLAVSYGVLLALTSNLLPSISEAFSNTRKTLTQYYTTMSYKWGGLITGFYCAALLAVADRFILGASGVQFQRAAMYVIPLVIYYAMGFPCWTNDVVTLAANRPYIKTLMTLVEQVVRVVLVLLMIGKLQIYALVAAYMVALMLKNIIGLIVNHRVNFRQKIFVWQTFIAPLLAGVVHYFIIRYGTGLIWKNNAGTSMLIFIVGVVLSFPLYSFFYGLFGGWDNNTLEDFHRAVKISNFAKPITWLFWKTSTLGARISPLHGKFPIRTYEEAMQEANSLTQERVKLVLEESASGEVAD
jgi:O-antigen/teichoic acid export membrane protein